LGPILIFLSGAPRSIKTSYNHILGKEALLQA
jgi:hypothetical protein